MQCLRMLRHQIHKLPIPINHVVLDLVGCDFGEELAGAFDLTFLNLPQVHA